MTARKIMEKARSILVLEAVFWANLALRLELTEDPKCETMWTDGKKLGYNPESISNLPLKQVIGIIAHEAEHCALLHHLRRGNRDAKKWNIATDYAVNGMLKDRFELPDWVLINSDFDGLSADQIYSKLPAPGDEEESQSQQGDDSDGSGDPGGCGEVRDATDENGDDLSEAEKSKLEADWKVNVAQATQQAKAMGDGLSTGQQRTVDEILNPTLDFEVLLQNFMDRVTKDNYSWSQPNRRFIHSGIYLPSAYDNVLGTVVFASDTSISINRKALNRTTSELSHGIKSTGAESYVVHCDNQIRKVEHFENGDFPEKLEPVGGGGTDFRPVFDWVEKEMIDPVCLIYFTDLAGTFPDEEPPYPVLWITWDKYPYTIPKFGQVISVV